MKYVLDQSKAHHRFFEDICAIPHESFNEKGVAEYIIRFAKERGLWFYTDQLYNVIVKKPGTPGYETAQPVMLQAHTDMVCEKTPDSDFNFGTDPLQLYVEDGCVRARGTTLGADDGYGVAYMLAVLDAGDIPHPPLECLFSTQEEAGIGGPRGLDYSKLSAKKLINMDGITEGSTNIATTSVIGGDWVLPVAAEPNTAPCMEIAVTGLNAGHASLNIVKEQANAVKIAARMLFAISREALVHVCSVHGGTIRNGIPEECRITFTCDPAFFLRAREIVEEITGYARIEHIVSDPGLTADVRKVPTCAARLTGCSSRTVLEFLHALPTGTLMRNRQAEHVPLISRNLGNVSLDGEAMTVGYMFRGAHKMQIADLFDQTVLMCARFGAVYREDYRYSGFNADLEWPLLRLWQQVYREFTGKDLFLKVTHGGSDIGTIVDGMNGMEVIVLSPTITDVHRPTESMDLESFDRTYGYLCEILKRLK